MEHCFPLTKQTNALSEQAKQIDGHLPYVFGPARRHSSHLHLSLNHPTTSSEVGDTEKSYMLMIGGHYPSQQGQKS